MLGSGTELDPFLIASEEDLIAIDAHFSQVTNNYYCYKLVSNINMSANPFRPLGKIAGKLFFGTFDGDGHKINNLYINEGSDYAGLFYKLGNNSAIKDLALPNVDIRCGGKYIGAFGGSGGSAIINNCWSTGSVKYEGSSVAINQYVGGLFGYYSGGSINNSFSKCNVYGNKSVGGFIGWCSSTTINRCYSTGNVNAVSTSTNDFGGFIGSRDIFSTPKVYNSYWDKDTSGKSTSNGGTGKTSAEMKMQSTYADWDFISIWQINEGTDYPSLQLFKNVSISEAYVNPIEGSSEIAGKKKVIIVESYIAPLETNALVEPQLIIDSFDPETLTLNFSVGSRVKSVKIYLASTLKQTFTSGEITSHTYQLSKDDLVFGDNLLEIQALDDVSPIASKKFNVRKISNVNLTGNYVIARSKRYQVASVLDNGNNTVQLTLDRNIERNLSTNELVEVYKNSFLPYLDDVLMSHVKTVYKNDEAEEQWDLVIDKDIINLELKATRDDVNENLTISKVKQKYHQKYLV